MEVYMRKIFIIIFIVLGGVLGCALGDYFSAYKGLSFLGIGGKIGFTNPLVVDFSFINFTFGFSCKINIAGIICILIFALLSKKVVSWLKI